jgi:hypothetical protein
MNKSIRVLKLPLDLISKIESYGIYHIHELINNLNMLELDISDFDVLNKTLTGYKQLQLIS